MFVDWIKCVIYVYVNYKFICMGDRECKIKRSLNFEWLEINEKNYNVFCILIYIVVIFFFGLLLFDVYKVIVNYFFMYYVYKIKDLWIVIYI